MNRPFLNHAHFNTTERIMLFYHRYEQAIFCLVAQLLLFKPCVKQWAEFNYDSVVISEAILAANHLTDTDINQTVQYKKIYESIHRNNEKKQEQKQATQF